MRTQKESEQVKGTHFLEGAEGAINEDREKVGRQRALTLWRVQKDDQVRIPKEIKWGRDTHTLESAKGETDKQDPKRMRARRQWERGRNFQDIIISQSA
jgi:hypothetical protein